jgi:hypothetical protein
VWRIALDLFVGLNALAGIAGFTLRFLNKKRRVSHLEYQDQLRRENDELERLRKEIEGK